MIATVNSEHIPINMFARPTLLNECGGTASIVEISLYIYYESVLIMQQ